MEKILMVLATVAVVAASAAQEHPAKRIHPKFAASLEKHTCDHEHENERTRIIVQSSCGPPKDVFVELKPEASHIQVLPPAVWVKRCVGVCSNPGKQCTAVEKRERHVPVRYINAGTGEESCATYAVEEHVQCSCCTGTPADCSRGQHFNHQARRESFEPEVESV